MTEKDRDSRERDGREDGELKVTDRRLFSPDGRLRDDIDLDSEDDDARGDDAVDERAEHSATTPPEAPPTTAGASPQREDLESGEERGFDRKPLDEPEGVNFTMLINGMAQPALFFLGELPHPGTEQVQVDLEQAQLQIDMLQLLRVKCRGNLTADEEGLLDRILYQLRMLYVSRSNQAAT